MIEQQSSNVCLNRSTNQPPPGFYASNDQSFTAEAPESLKHCYYRYHDRRNQSEIVGMQGLNVEKGAAIPA